MENGKIWVTDLPEHVKIISTGQDFVKLDQQVLTQKPQKKNKKSKRPWTRSFNFA